MQCSETEFLVIFVCYVFSISVKVKFSVSHFDEYKHWGLQYFYAYYGIAWGTIKLVMDGNTNVSERGESEGACLCGDLNQDK